MAAEITCSVHKTEFTKDNNLNLKENLCHNTKYVIAAYESYYEYEESKETSLQHFHFQ